MLTDPIQFFVMASYFDENIKLEFVSWIYYFALNHMVMDHTPGI